MKDLAAQQIRMCAKGTTPLTPLDYAALLSRLPGWHAHAVEGVILLEKRYRLDSVGEATEFSTRIMRLADAANHHPRLDAEAGALRVRWWTHTIRGLHLNDFIMAARCDETFELSFGGTAGR